MFLLTSDYPTLSSDWELTPNVIDEIELSMYDSDPVTVELGGEYTHVLYQSNRDDITGDERIGLWYAHGSSDQTSWTYRKAIGDEAGMQKMSVITHDGSDYIYSVWKEGSDAESKLVAKVTDSTMTALENLSVEIPSKGIGNIQMTETHLGIQIFYDFVGPTGSQIQYGLMNPIHDEEWIGLSDRITTGKNHLSSVDRSPLSDQSIILSWNEINGWEIRSLIDDNDPDRGDLNLLDEMRIYLGLDEQNFAILMAGISITVLLICLLVLSTMSLSALKWVGRKRRRVATGNIVLEENVVDIVDSTDIEIKSSEIELIDEDIEETNTRKQRRESRKNSNLREMKIGFEEKQQELSVPPQVIPLPPSGLAEMPQINRQILCPECSSRFEVSMGLKMIKCPICDNRISL